MTSMEKSRKDEVIMAEYVQDPETGEKLHPIANVDYSGAAAKTDPKEIKLVRKLDLWIMPMLWLMYWLNYLDRNAITLAKLNTLEEDTNITNTQYLTCVSILFVGYIVAQVPSNMLITRVRPSWYMAGAMALWAVVSALTALANSYTSLLITRFLLGIVEAPFYPGAIWLLGIFYTRKEIATRISILYSANMFAMCSAGLIAIGVFDMHGMAGVSGWQWLFIIQGALTFVVALASAFVLPNQPLDTWWLTEEEKQLAHNRVTRDTVHASSSTGSVQGLLVAMKDPRVWLFVFMQHMHLAANGFKNFLPTVVETLGFEDQKVTLALVTPPYFLAGVISIVWAASSGRFNERTWHLTIAKGVAVVGFIIGTVTLNTGARYFSMILFCIGTYCANSIIYAWTASTCGQTVEKKASALALVSTISNVAFVWTPYLWPSSDAPAFRPAMISSAGFSIVCAGSAWVMKLWLMRMNRKIRMDGDERVLRYAY
ncbi:hypothetical protein CERZMDRAFT_84892 [Cercospora zeae-maydis SCOH1-5]|uniref:Major facilitator superfamily (MFS) profile domain-containing protein n=1 Tax=Cercospora zeae-maydis SCOH1-5 TaxID=717836 RepID=A0A6A6FEV0_9PEZI|nr:hypothetical protein CERZMDRAFT_84892 [Cercospora zeae-maydis SCOH1-5]